MKVLKNFRNTGEFLDGDFPHIKLRNDEDVFYDMPICVADCDRVYKDPVLMTENTGSPFPFVYEKVELLQKIAKLKKFYFKVDEHGKMKEVKPEEANLSYRLPPDTPVKDLMYKNGRIILLEKIETETEDKEKSKKKGGTK